jgi:hypothetical protein
MFRNSEDLYTQGVDSQEVVDFTPAKLEDSPEQITSLLLVSSNNTALLFIFPYQHGNMTIWIVLFCRTCYLACWIFGEIL